MQYFTSIEGAPGAIGPYSQAVKVGGMVLVSGQVGIDPQSGDLVSGGVLEEAKQVMKNLAAVLKGVGCDFSDVAMSTIFLKSMDDFSKVNKLYGSFFESGKAPARATVEVSRLPKDANIEISMIAHKD